MPMITPAPVIVALLRGRKCRTKSAMPVIRIATNAEISVISAS